jgi:hypothetical protein
MEIKSNQQHVIKLCQPNMECGISFMCELTILNHLIDGKSNCYE